ncbi:hypothetical protein NA57DRAFT_51466 [Rhizodiscina lignyota]|uniref:Uncharacterized protein n=1 Tax=Rhizodiscina lignyota TaxID=1504668 RepID=A0A9P4MGM6_9PEZI|nr:hypothetical protein NA57DRAFT_51466 [Rhizodiscina lignyota]
MSTCGGCGAQHQAHQRRRFLADDAAKIASRRPPKDASRPMPMEAIFLRAIQEFTAAGSIIVPTSHLMHVCLVGQSAIAAIVTAYLMELGRGQAHTLAAHLTAFTARSSGMALSNRNYPLTDSHPSGPHATAGHTQKAEKFGTCMHAPHVPMHCTSGTTRGLAASSNFHRSSTRAHGSLASLSLFPSLIDFQGRCEQTVSSGQTALPAWMEAYNSLRDNSFNRQPQSAVRILPVERAAPAHPPHLGLGP